MARLAEWHNAHPWNAKRLRFRSAVCGRRFREQLRRIDCRRQRPVLVRPVKEEILKDFWSKSVSAPALRLDSESGTGSKQDIKRQTFPPFSTNWAASGIMMSSD